MNTENNIVLIIGCVVGGIVGIYFFYIVFVIIIIFVLYKLCRKGT